MTILTRGAIAALFMGLLMGASLKPSQSVAAHAENTPHLSMDPANTGLVASASLIAKHSG